MSEEKSYLCYGCGDKIIDDGGPKSDTCSNCWGGLGSSITYSQIAKNQPSDFSYTFCPEGRPRQKTALITGVTGQDGSYLAELLLEKGYKVVGMTRRTSTDNTARLKEVLGKENFTLEMGDITDASSVLRLIKKYLPDEIYNLAAMSHVAVSFEQPGYTWESVAVGCLNVLEAVRFLQTESYKPKVYQASSSEMFGSNCSEIRTENKLAGMMLDSPDVLYVSEKGPLTKERWSSRKFQDEQTPFSPCSPYGVAKLAAHNMVNVYRKSYGIFAVSGILNNHESTRRGDNFVTKKITNWIKDYKEWYNPVNELGQVEPLMKILEKHDEENRLYNSLYDEVGFPKLKLGNLDAKRDWSHALDMIEGMVMMLQNNEPKDYVLASGKAHSVRDFLKEAFEQSGLGDFSRYVVIDESLKRPYEVDYLCGDASLAREELGWMPKISFAQLVKDMLA